MQPTTVYVLAHGRERYVGITSKLMKERMAEHENGEGSEWTARWNGRVQLMHTSEHVTRQAALVAELRETAQCVMSHGLENVRGAKFSQVSPTLAKQTEWCETIADILELDYAEVKAKLLPKAARAQSSAAPVRVVAAPQAKRVRSSFARKRCRDCAASLRNDKRKPLCFACYDEWIAQGIGHCWGCKAAKPPAEDKPYCSSCYSDL